MKLAPQSRDILRQYKALINARRRDAGQGGTSAASGHAKTLAGCACRRETSPRLRRRALSSSLSVAVAREYAYYQGYLPVKQTGDTYVKVEYRRFSKRGAGQSCRR